MMRRFFKFILIITFVVTFIGKDISFAGSKKGPYRPTKFQRNFAWWSLLSGASLSVAVLSREIKSFDNYMQAYKNMDMPASWCPTLLNIYSLSTLLDYFHPDKFYEKVSKVTGTILLPMGLYVLTMYTAESSPGGEDGDGIGMYIYAQSIHVTEIIAGIHTLKRLIRDRDASKEEARKEKDYRVVFTQKSLRLDYKF